MTRRIMCQLCRKNDAAHAMQYIASDQPSFYALGWHIRGFQVTKVCDDCKEKIKSGKDQK